MADTLKRVECAGAPREMGRQTGEALREDIAANLAARPLKEPERWLARLPGFVETTQRHLPSVLEEMEGMAEGANRPVEDIYRLNFPLWSNGSEVEGCTNVVFSDGSDGPVWGKNNDGMCDVTARAAFVRHIKPDQGIPQVVFGMAGWVASTDGMNAEGLTTGHSSVGSVFQQSDRYPFIRLWDYVARSKCRTTEEYVREMTATPLRGKGYSIVCVDRHGTAASLEAACPLVQVRRPDRPRGIHCVNCYQLPALANADRRKPSAKIDARARAAYLDRVLDGGGTFDIEHMKRLLRNHADQGICRHGSETSEMNTEYAMIGVPVLGKVFYCGGHPCEGEFETLSV